MDHADFLRLDAAARLSPEELAKTSPELLAGLRENVTVRAKASLVEQFGDAPKELRDAVAEVDVAPREGGDFNRDVIDALEARGLPAATIDAAKARIATLAAPIDPIAELPPNLPVAANPEFQSDLAVARVHRLVSISAVEDAKADAVTAKGLTVETLDDATLAALVNTKDLTENDAKDLGLTVGLYRMLDGDPALTERVKAAQIDAVPSGKVTDPRDLVHLDEAAWVGLLSADGIEVPEGVSREQYATVLAKRAATAFPSEALFARAKAPDPAALASAVTTLKPLLDKGGVLTAAVDLAKQPEKVRKSHEEMQRLVDRYAGLGLGEIFEDKRLKVPQRVKKATDRIQLVPKLAAANPDVELLGLDWSHGSDDVKALKFTGIAAADQPAVIANVKMKQRLYAVMRDPQDVDVVAAAGYHSATSIVAGGFDRFSAKTGLSAELARTYFDEALSAIASTTTAMTSLVDVVRGGFRGLRVANLSPGIEDYFRQIDGWDDLFGSQDYCRCEHCSSILSPAAYFVDLMRFVEDNLTSKVFTGALADHVLALPVRRPDLWTLPLTCENTETEIPLLVVVDEILENWIAKRFGFAGDIADRAKVWRHVYKNRLSDAVDSFSQPFLLPLERLEAYLAHFGRTRSAIAAAVGGDADAVASATLGLSSRERQLILEVNTAQAFLRRVYGVEFTFQAGGTVTPFDAQELVEAIGVSRDELGDLLATRFVQAGTAEPIEIKAERRDAQSIQNDVERIHGLRTTSLDRLHRFTRLWRKSGWTVRELDLSLAHLTHAGLAAGIDDSALRRIVRLRELARRFNLDVEETAVLYDELPTTSVREDEDALFSRLFNLDDFVKLDGTYPKDATDFVHPALRADPAAPAPDHTLQRLLAGLRVDADRLLQLILGLAPSLGLDQKAAAEADRGFALTVANLSLLYRHARLAEWLKLPVPELFRTIGIAPGIAGAHVATLDELEALLEFVDWLKSAKLKLDDVAFTIGDPVLDARRFPTPTALAQRVVERVAADNPLTFGENIFTFLPDVSEAGSRAILAANPGSVLKNDDGSYRLADDFNPRAALTIPAGVAVGEPAARALLVARHATEIVPIYLAAELRVDVAKARALVALSALNLSAPTISRALRGESPPARLERVVEVVQRLAVLLQGSAFDAEAVEFVRAHPGVFALADVEAPTLEAMRKLDIYRQLARGGEDRAADVRAVLGAFAAGSFTGADQAALARVLGVETAVASSLQAHLTLPATAPEALRDLSVAAELARWIGVDGGTLAEIADTDYDRLDAAADAVLAAFRAKYPDEEKWREQIAPFEGRILNRRRDGLCDYLVHTIEPEFETRADLYRYFLVDVEVDGCFMTSRVVAAMSSLQLYVHRVLMNLEQDQAGNLHVQPSLVPRDEWEWRQHYRVWEANRKVYLWAENYVFPDLRDDKSPLFEELEGELLQKEIDQQAVLDAYGKYLEGFQEVSALRIAGSYHDVDERDRNDVLHLFGVTAAEPPNYFYRRVDNARYGEIVDSKGVVWGPWRPMDVKIPVRRVAPVVHNGRLHVFWIEVVSAPQNEVADAGSRFVGYTHKLSLKYTTLRLDGRWTPPQRISLYGATPFVESDGVVDDPLAEPEEWRDFVAALGGLLGWGIFSNPDAIGKLSDAQRRLITPRYDTQPHTKARDGYTLKGLEWAQVYPEPLGSTLFIWASGYQLRGSVDLFDKVTANAAGFHFKRIAWAYTSRVPSPVLGIKSGGLYYGTRTSSMFDRYAYAALAADSARFARVLREWPSTLLNSVSAGLWAVQIASVGARSEVQPINGSLTDGILDVDGDLYLLQSSVRDGARWLVKRLGTTLAETVSRALFTNGVDGLLDYDTQRQLAEAPRGFSLVGSKIEDAIKTAKIDFTGSYGVYYREIFFHIPFLIAQTLNAQGKFAEAQKWYQYVFDPTSSEIIRDRPGLSPAENAARKRDRNWRYIEFRNLDLPTLRGILTDPRAIEAYKTDPFNPHAIARLRLSAYQKAIVMRYIDNLLDWADELFTQFQMETVNEAMMLYATAADILGDRPAQLGTCGEGLISPRTYERIKPLLDKGSDFLIELEHWSFVNHGRAYLGKVKNVGRFTIDPVKISTVNEVLLGLARVKAAGVASRDWTNRLVAAAATEVEDVVDDGRLVNARIAAAKAPFGSLAEPVAEVRRGRVRLGSDGAAEVPPGSAPKPQVEQPALVGLDGTVAKAGMFATDLTRTVDWKRASGELPESRYLPARDRKIRDIVVKNRRVYPHFGWSVARQVSPAFCVPPNKDLLGYWDRLEDRLFKLRNCMDITGVRRSLSLFAPEIDPMLLVRARAAGLSLDDVLDALAGELPPYRFSFLLDRAKSFAATVQSYGSALLGALERMDAEELNELRIVHQQQLLALTTDVRRWELASAVAAVEALERRREGVEHRLAYYRSLVDVGLTAEEWTQRISRHVATALRGTEATLNFLSGALHLIPQLGSPFAMKYGGAETGSSARSFAAGARSLADFADVISASAALEAGFARRDQGWRQQVQAAQDELAELDKQIQGAELRRDIAERSIELHEKTLEQTNEIYDLYRERFTGLGLYSWLSTETQRLYREAYNAAYALARMAERAYRFERDDLSVSLQASYWDASRAGLRAGERLLIDLQRLERKYIETNYRCLEVDQSFSLLQLNPAALVQLRQTGRCEFEIPELAFDIVYPGHYRRRIRSVRLTVPSITGPYTNVSATLRMLDNQVRREPKLGDEHLVRVPLPHSTTIATSTAQNDGGVFELNFHDERYMPFEGAGAVSRWQLELPASFRQFDYQTINDVILGIAYTAEEDGVLRQTVEQLAADVEGSILNVLSNEPLGRLFSLRQDFSTAYSRLLHGPPGTPVTIEITDKYFPAFLGGRELDVTSATLVVRPVADATVGGLTLKLDGANQTGFAPGAELGDLPAKDVSSVLSAGIVGEHTIEVVTAGDLAPETPEPGDDSALDDDKVADILLYVQTMVS